MDSLWGEFLFIFSMKKPGRMINDEFDIFINSFLINVNKL